jgi:hypothetical protein
MILERDHRVGEDRQADARRPQQRGVTLDVATGLEPAQSPPARRGREPDALGELLVGDARVRLQFLEDAPVEAVEAGSARRGCGGSRLPGFGFTGNNIAKYGP